MPSKFSKFRLKPLCFLASVFFVFIIVGAGCSDSGVPVRQNISSLVVTSSIQYNQQPSTAVVKDLKPIVNTKLVVPVQKDEAADLSNNNYYTNVDGNTVHAPAYALEENSVPIGASARCRDGTYSFSQNRRGTCSHHDGVAEWL